MLSLRRTSSVYSYTQLVNFGSSREQKSEKIQVRSYIISTQCLY